MIEVEGEKPFSLQAARRDYYERKLKYGLFVDDLVSNDAVSILRVQAH